MPSKNTVIVLAAILTVIPGFLTSPSPAFAASKEKVLHSFDGSDGAYPDAGLIFDGAGNLYGTTIDGGAYGWGCGSGGGCGTAFKLTPGANGRWKEKVLHSFGHGNDGSAPVSPVTLDAAGNLYGTAEYGGGCSRVGCGIVFELSPGPGDRWTQKILHSFAQGTDGDSPRAGLIFDARGSLFGTTFWGGDYGGGTVFKLTPCVSGQWKLKVLHSFGSGSDGTYPYGGLIFDAAGNLYGTTMQGGASAMHGGGSGWGTVFELVPGARGKWTEKVLYRFTGNNGDFYPWGTLLLDAAGSLYGVTRNTVFKLSRHCHGKWTEKVLHTFDGGTDGEYPNGGLIFDSTGSIFGTTSVGGGSGCFNGCGTVFQLTPAANDTWTEKVLHSFGSGTNGAYPWAPLILDALGNLYGTTGGGGSKNCQAGQPCGVVFEIKR